MTTKNIPIYKQYVNNTFTRSAIPSSWNKIKTTDIQGRSKSLRHFYSGMGLKLGVFGFLFFPRNHGLSGVYVTYIYCSLKVKINMRKTLHSTRRSWTHLFYICFCVCGWQKPEDSNLSLMADQVITWGSIRGLGSPLYICDISVSFNNKKKKILSCCWFTDTDCIDRI